MNLRLIEAIELHLGFEDITKIYGEALENETGMPINNLANVFDYDSYELSYDSLTDITKIKILGAYVQFEMEDTDIICVNYCDINKGRGWYLMH